MSSHIKMTLLQAAQQVFDTSIPPRKGWFGHRIPYASLNNNQEGYQPVKLEIRSDQAILRSLCDKGKRHRPSLKTLDEYDVDDVQETATTILAGIKHNGRDVQIVVRPAYDGTVIIYYQSEQDVLDYEDYELWVDTGTGVRRITFGHILKTTEIRRFPI